MSGALAERVFALKLRRVGFEGVQVLERRPFGLEQAADYPLFTAELIKLMGQVIPVEGQHRVAMSVVITASKPG